MSGSREHYRIDGYLPADDDVPLPKLELTSDTGLPSGIDLRPNCSPVEDQGHVGSCTANSIVGALEDLQIASGSPMTDLSRLFVYYNARRFSDQEGVDCGASMPHAMASLLAFGACPEVLWPYDEARWGLKPEEACYQNTIRFQGLHYASVSPNDERKYVLASGLPIIFGMGVPQHLLMVVGGQTGYMPPPSDGRWEKASSGHAMLIVGYSDAKNAWLVRNSWGTDYGIDGHVWIDYHVMDHYGMGPQAFWTVGPLDKNKFFRLSGASSQAAQDHIVQQAPLQTQDFLSRFRQEVRTDLSTHLDATRKGLRERLRGPGAGGGYDRGPGVGGGYDD